ncbi:sensor histidine kinase [Oxalobacteraceae bacterium R-40]|uniref:histidine kinase n=1 Tax=Keguizhuia sedimenti TaxID=3064264 RepID=A0ABU1BKX6_9BURK|nr:sensor histidine kinase [Oxalobacteraceae bacterium R-40]
MKNTQNQKTGKFSATAQRMLDLREAIFSEWEKRVRANIEHARDLPHPLLINTFPAYFSRLVEAVSPGFPRKIATDTNTIAIEHGGERARLTNYDPRAVIAEFQHLRWAILDVLQKHGVHFSADEFYIFNASIDAAICESATAYMLTQSAFREQFVAALTHDLRNPLHSIITAAELILRTDDPEKIRELAGKVIENGHRIDRMTKDMLDCALFQNGERLTLNLSCFDILELAREVCEQAAINSQSRIELNGEAAEGWWDRDAIKRAIENLIGNAVKYGAHDEPVKVHISPQHERVTISVHNKGDPVDPEQMESIFQVFRRTEAAKSGNRQGWGIGLPYVRSVAESHGGSVVVDSCVARGTTFIIDLPVDARPYQGTPTLNSLTK